jgi:hypothetical protein
MLHKATGVRGDGPVVVPSAVDEEQALEVGEARERVIRREHGLLALLAPDAHSHVRCLLAPPQPQNSARPHRPRTRPPELIKTLHSDGMVGCEMQAMLPLLPATFARAQTATRSAGGFVRPGAAQCTLVGWVGWHRKAGEAPVSVTNAPH